jgi:hypothetical protein
VAEHAFVLESSANAISHFGNEKLRFDCLPWNLAEPRRLSANEINHVEVVSDQALRGFGDLRKIKVGDSPAAAATFHLNLEASLAVRGDEIVAGVVAFVCHIFDLTAPLFQVPLYERYSPFLDRHLWSLHKHEYTCFMRLIWFWNIVRAIVEGKDEFVIHGFYSASRRSK